MKTIKVAVEAKKTLPLGKLEPFQQDIKTLSKEQYEKLRTNILKNGFSFAVHVWQNKGKNYIIDGHQRIFAVKQLVDIEGYEMPPVPVAVVKAASFKEAKRKVLAGASLYGRVNQTALQEFLESNELDFESVVAQFDLPDINFGDFGIFSDEASDKLPPPQAQANGMPSSSEGVKQVQLFFTTEAHAEFMAQVEYLSKKFNTENLTDTVIWAVDAQYQAEVAES